MGQINPPYDGSAPCPACQDDLRGIAASLHNSWNRWERREPKMFSKLNDMRRSFTSWDKKITVPHPASAALAALVGDIVEAMHDVVDEGHRITWTAESYGRLPPLERVTDVMKAWRRLSDAHFHDLRHYRGDENVLREAKGSRHELSGGESYDYTVEETVGGPGDLIHHVCGVQLKLHDHFKQHLADDPTFYGKVYCPRCRQNLPFGQFSYTPIRAAAA